jgi:HAMP domain-containing protein
VQTSLKLLKTSTFRLAALYLLLFAVSVAALLAYVYWNTALLLERQTDETIRAEIQALADQYRLRGLTGIIDTVQRRSREETGSIYLLTDAVGARIAGNIDRLPAEAVSDREWIEFPLDVRHRGIAERHMVRAFHTDLTGDYELVVGRDVEALRQFAAIIRRALFWALGIALVLGLGGGLLMSRNFLHRVDAITDASRSIMGGNMQGRMPVSGSGDELDRLAQSLNEMLDRIERLMTGMQEVSSNVAPISRRRSPHQGSCRGRCGREECRIPRRWKNLEDSDRLLQTFNALLSSPGPIGQSRSGFAAIDASTILADVAELYEPTAEEQGGALTIAAPEGLEIVPTGGSCLRR